MPSQLELIVQINTEIARGSSQKEFVSISEKRREIESGTIRITEDGQYRVLESD